MNKIDLVSSPEHPVLILERFNGIEIYPIELAEWNLYRDKDSGMMNLWISLAAGRATEQQEDTVDLYAQPNWELNLVEPELSEDAIEPGFIATIPEAYDESRNGWITCFYYCSHEGTDRNTIEMMEINGDRVRWRLTGETIDVNYYDGSKPATKLSVDTWFDRNRDCGRSMS
jgi:hypothetical protein